MASNYQSHVAVIGLKETLRALDQMDRRTRKEVREELHRAAIDVRDLAKSYVDPEGLSGWGKWKGGYSARNIEAGIRVTRATRTAFGGGKERSFIAVVNSNVAGAIWEVAGRKSDGRKARKGRRRQRIRVGRRYEYTGVLLGGYGNGVGFVRAIRDRGGPASRTVWAAYDQTDAGFIKRRIEQMLIREAKTTQARIDLNPY